MKKFKGFLFIMVMALVTLVAVGCDEKTKIQLSFEKESYSVVLGEEITIEPKVTNEKNEEYKLVYASKDESFVTYKDGKVKGVAVGEAKIRVSLEGFSEVFAEATVKVEPKPTAKVSFNVDGGSAIADVTVVKGEAVDRPTNPIKEGYVFKGWFKDAGKTQEYDFEDAVNADLTLYAKWEIAKYDVSFDSAGGSKVEPIPVTHGSKITKPADPTKDKNVFVGWFTDSGYKEEFDFDTPIVRDITLYAKWEPVKYTVTFNVDGGSEVAAQQVVIGGKATKPANPTKANHMFIGWFKEAAGTNVFDFTKEEINADTTVYAVWVAESEIKEVTLNWNYANKDDEVISFLWDFYTWLDSKGIIDADEMTFAAFSGKDKTGTGVDSKFIGEYIKYIGLSGDALALNNTDYFANSVNHLRLQGPRDTAPNTINDSYFFNSTEYNAKWVQYANWIHDETKAHTNRFWDQSVGQYDIMRYITGLNFTDGSYVKVDGTANYNKGDFSMTIKYHAYSDDALPTVTLYGKTFKEWNTKADGTGQAYSELPVDSPEDLELFAIWED